MVEYGYCQWLGDFSAWLQVAWVAVMVAWIKLEVMGVKVALAEGDGKRAGGL